MRRPLNRGPLEISMITSRRISRACRKALSGLPDAGGGGLQKMVGMRDRDLEVSSAATFISYWRRARGICNDTDNNGNNSNNHNDNSKYNNMINIRF